MERSFAPSFLLVHAGTVLDKDFDDICAGILGRTEQGAGVSWACTGQKQRGVQSKWMERECPVHFSGKQACMQPSYLNLRCPLS